MPLTRLACRLVGVFAAAVTTLGMTGGLVGSARASASTAPVFPQLTSASVVTTTPTSKATAGRPAGTQVLYQFDEPLDSSLALNPTSFKLYDEDGTAFPADDARVDQDKVTALFQSLDTPQAAANISLASTVEGAVTDLDGDHSPVGAVRVTLPDPVTGLGGCGVLRRVNNFLVGEHRTTVDFVFSCLAGYVSDVIPSRFHLDVVRGGVRSGLHQAVHRPTGTVTVTFPGRVPRRLVSRGTVGRWAFTFVVSQLDDMGDVEGGDEYGTALQSVPVSHDGHTARPDLRHVKLQPGAGPNVADQAIFVFDQRVRTPVARRFLVSWDSPRRHRPGSVSGLAATRVNGHPRWVRVDFGRHLDRVVAASVGDGAVHSARADAVDVTSSDYTRTSTGLTPAADLREVFYGTTNPLLTATFVFDEPVVGEPDPAAFGLYGPGGEAWSAENCVLVPSGDADGWVKCTFPGSTPTSGWLEITGTVDAGAVLDADGRANPEGASSFWAPMCSGAC